MQLFSEYNIHLTLTTDRKINILKMGQEFWVVLLVDSGIWPWLQTYWFRFFVNPLAKPAHCWNSRLHPFKASLFSWIFLNFFFLWIVVALVSSNIWRLLSTIRTSDTELILSTYIVTPTSTGGPVIRVCNSIWIAVHNGRLVCFVLGGLFVKLHLIS